MPGLAAVVLPEASELEAVIGAMVGRMAHYPWLRQAQRIDVANHVGLGAVVFEAFANRSMIATPDRQLAVVFVGELFDTDGERRRLERAGVRFETDSESELLLKGWQTEGPEFLSVLNGEFSALVWDAIRRELHVVTDRFGLRPLYVAEVAGGFAVASEIKSILAVPGVSRSWSESGISQFFAFGHFLNDETLFADVRAMPAATVGTYQVDARRYAERRYWQLRWGTVKGSADDLAAALDERLTTAVARRARSGERLGLSLSGGLDARTLLGVLPAGANLKTVSLGIEGSLDHKSAGELSAIAGVPHHQQILDTAFLSEFERHLRQLVLVTDGHYLDQGIVMSSLPVYRQLGIDYLMRGHGGELMHMTKAYAFSLDQEALGASQDGFERWLLSHLTEYMLAGVPHDLFTMDLRAGASAALHRALARCQPTARPVDRAWELFLNERIHRETTLSMHVFGGFSTIRQPYLDNDVIDLLFSLPAEMKLGDELQTRILRRRRPAFLRVTNANTGAQLGAGTLVTGLARLKLKVAAKLGLKGYQPYERLGLWLRHELRPLLERTLTSNRFLESGLFNADATRAAICRHVSGERNHTFLLMSLLVFAAGIDAREATGEPQRPA